MLFLSSSSTQCLLETRQLIPREDEKIRIYVKLLPGEYPTTPDGQLDRLEVKSEAVRQKILNVKALRFVL